MFLLFKRSVQVSFLILISAFPMAASADHGPKKMWKRQIVPYFTAHETGMVGPFEVNIQSYGSPSQASLPENTENYDKVFKDRVNLAAIVARNNTITYSRFNEKRKIGPDTPIQGMSMSKTALAGAVGSLLCNGDIKSLDDTMGLYSENLAATPYSEVTIRNVLQMNSGVTPLGRKDVKLSNRIAMGLAEFEGKADLLAAVQHFDKAVREQGAEHNYHAADSFALSLLISDITGISASQVFYENIFVRLNPVGAMHWAADNEGRTVSQARLVMTAPDWNSFGQFILNEIKSGSCIGNFFQDGLDRAVKTSRKNVGYGYQFWVYDINGEAAITMTGHGGFFNVLSQEKNTVLSIFSIDEKYKAGNLFSNGVLSKVAGKIIY